MKDGGNRILTLALLFVFCSLGAIGSSGQPPSADDSRIPRDAVLIDELRGRFQIKRVSYSTVNRYVVS